MKNICNKSIEVFCLLIVIVFLVTSSCTREYDSAYVHIDSPSDNALFRVKDTIVFKLSSKKSGVMFEFDACKFKIYNQKTGVLILDREVQDTIHFITNGSDTTIYVASAEYWREDAKSASKTHQIHFKVLP